jgi:hypothetical protein
MFLKHTPNSGTIRLSFSLICTIGVFLLILFALILMIVGLAGELLGPALVSLGHDLLLSAGGIFLLIVSLKISKRIAQTLLRALFASSFASQVRPWVLWSLWMLRRLLTAFIRWYLDQERKWEA